MRKKGFAIASKSAPKEQEELPNITPEFMALVLFKQDLGINVQNLAEEFNVTYSQLKEFRLAKLANPLVLMHYNDLMQSFKSEWLSDGSLFMKKALQRLTQLIQRSDDMKEIARAIEVVGGVLSDNHVAFASGAYMLSKIPDSKLLNSSESTETFADVLEAANKKIDEATLKEYDLEHLAQDYVDVSPENE